MCAFPWLCCCSCCWILCYKIRVRCTWHCYAMQCDAYKQRANKKDKRTFVTSENKTGNSAKNSKLFIDCAGIANNYGENVAILLDIFALSLTFNSHLLQWIKALLTVQPRDSFTKSISIVFFTFPQPKSINKLISIYIRWWYSVPTIYESMCSCLAKIVKH